MRKKELLSVTLVFENCEEERIPIKYIDAFSMDGITKELSINSSKELMEFETVGKTLIRIKPEGNITHKGLIEKDNMLLFDRIQKWSDITQIEIEFLDNIESQFYFVKYNSDEHDSNKWQHNWIDDLGNLWIVISDNNDYIENCKDDSNTYFVKK